MTLSQIMTLALRQLDEDPQDISEYDELFRIYANAGLRFAIAEYVKPRVQIEAESDENGTIAMPHDWVRIVDIRLSGESVRRNVFFELAPTGDAIKTAYPNKSFTIVAEVRGRDMEAGTDEPEYLPEEAHMALCDYVCYRHLMNGNMAKQSRAQQYLQAYYTALRQLRPQGFGSVTAWRNLYEASDIRAVRW